MLRGNSSSLEADWEGSLLEGRLQTPAVHSEHDLVYDTMMLANGCCMRVSVDCFESFCGCGLVQSGCAPLLVLQVHLVLSKPHNTTIAGKQIGVTDCSSLGARLHATCTNHSRALLSLMQFAHSFLTLRVCTNQKQWPMPSEQRQISQLLLLCSQYCNATIDGAVACLHRHHMSCALQESSHRLRFCNISAKHRHQFIDQHCTPTQLTWPL